jgi:hypothetical protein
MVFREKSESAHVPSHNPTPQHNLAWVGTTVQYSMALRDMSESAHVLSHYRYLTPQHNLARVRTSSPPKV